MAKRSAVYSVKVDSGSAVKDVKNLDKSFKGLNKTATTTKKTLSDTSGVDKFEKELQDLDALIDSGTLDLRQMTKVIQDYQTVAFKAGEKSPVGAKAIEKASALKDRITDLNNRVKQGSSDYAKMDAAIQGASGAMAGFQAFQGVSALMGQENEELVRTIMKLQASMSILNSIQVLRNTLNKDSAMMQQIQALQMRIRTKETYAQITAQKMANTVLGEGTKASKLFSKALLATGIGALVVAIGLLIANWDKLKQALGGATREQELSNEVTQKAIEASAEELSALDKLQNTINDETVSREDKVKAVKKLQETYPELLSNVDAEKVSIEELNKALELNAELVMLKAELDAIAEMRTEEVKKQIQAETDARTQNNKSLNTSIVGWFDETTARKLHNVEQAVSIKQSKEETSVLDAMSKSREEAIKLKRKELGLPEDDKKPPKVPTGKSKAQQERERQAEEVRQAELDALAFRNEVLDMIADAEEEFQTSSKQKELNAVNEKYFELISRAEEFGQETQILKDAQAKAELEIENKYKKQASDKAEALKQKEQAMILATEKLRIDAMIASAEKEKEVLQMSYDAKRLQVSENEILSAEEKIVLLSQLKEQEELALNAIDEKWQKKRMDDAKKESDAKKKMFSDYTASVSAGLGSLSALNDAVTQTQLNNAKGNAKEEEKIRKKSFERNKKLQIVTAIINGVQAVQSALASPFPLNIGLAVINGALAIANVAKIASTKYEGGGGGASSIAPSGASASPGASASSFSIGADTSATTTALNDDGSQVQEQGQPVQVFVTETDITETQNNVENIEVRSTF